MKTETMEAFSKRALGEMGFPVYKSGYRRLRVAMPCFALDPEQHYRIVFRTIVASIQLE